MSLCPIHRHMTAHLSVKANLRVSTESVVRTDSRETPFVPTGDQMMTVLSFWQHNDSNTQSHTRIRVLTIGRL